MDIEKKRYETFEEMYLSLYRLVYMFIRDYTKDWDTAQEISSILWLKVAEDQDWFLGLDASHILNYLRVMVKNEVSEQYRIMERENKKLEKIAALCGFSDTPEDEYIRKENLKKLEKLREQLSEEEKQLLELRFHEQLTVKETGNVMGLKQSAVKMRQLRILQKLKTRMMD